jgi:hypothetical protein
MGHVRLGVLPAGKKWAEVVRLLEDGANVPELANAVAVAAENEIIAARGDPTLASTVWLLTQLPLAARSDRYAAELAALGFPQGSDASLVNIVAGFSAAVTSQQSSASRRTDLGVLAQQAAAETLSTLVGARMRSLFGISAEDVRIELAKFATKDRFAALARDFFARLTHKTLDYYISRELPRHVGPDRGLASLEQSDRFRAALESHCREASLIVESFAGGWFSKANFTGRLTPQATQSFTDYALKKIRDELRARRADDA